MVSLRDCLIMRVRDWRTAAGSSSRSMVIVFEKATGVTRFDLGIDYVAREAK